MLMPDMGDFQRGSVADAIKLTFSLLHSAIVPVQAELNGTLWQSTLQHVHACTVCS